MTEDNPTMGVAVREPAQQVDRALSVGELQQRLSFIKEVMGQVMIEGQDYGKIPGCGDKPGLFQPGAQKLALTFQLAPVVHKEEVKELGNHHREYAYTLAIQSASGRVLSHGVGTCSTLEAKYRFRGGARKCPQCGKETIIKGKAEYGGGWLCFAKKGGCGAKWPEGASEIESQSVERVEHDNPADFWNTCQKMAFKRALVHGIINATNTSELWSQDLEDLPQDTPPPKTTTTPQPVAKNHSPAKPETGTGFLEGYAEQCKAKFLKICKEKNWGIYVWKVAVDRKWILPTEKLEDAAPAKFPLNAADFSSVEASIKQEQEYAAQNDGVSEQLAEAYDKVYAPVGGDKKAEPYLPPPDVGVVGPAQDEWFMDVIVPIPHRGEKRDVYLKHPDTIGSLYDARHDDEEARRRLWGFCENYEPKPWTKKDGTVVPPSEADTKFRLALDAFMDWFEKNHPDEKL